MLEYLRAIGNQSTEPNDRAIGKMAEAGLILRFGKDILFPGQLGTQSEVAPKVDLRQQTYKLLALVRAPIAEEREVLEAKRGLAFLHLGVKSYAQVVAEDEDYFLSNELAYANSKLVLKNYTLPVAGEFGFRSPEELALPNTFFKSRLDQLEIIEEYSQLLQIDVPDARTIMLPSTGYAMADRAYKARTGKILFRNYFARALDDLSGVYAARAGRIGPSRRFCVDDWDAGEGGGNVGGVPAVVFIGNK